MAMPRIPHPEINRIYPINIHGAMVYLTDNEYIFSKWLERLVFILFPTLFILLAINRYNEGKVSSENQ